MARVSCHCEEFGDVAIGGHRAIISTSKPLILLPTGPLDPVKRAGLVVTESEARLALIADCHVARSSLLEVTKSDGEYRRFYSSASSGTIRP